MIWFTANTLWVTILILGLHGLGWSLLEWSSWIERPRLRASLSLPLGVAVLVLCLNPIGWFGPGFGASWIVVCGWAAWGLSVLLAFRKGGRRWLVSAFTTAAIAAVGTLPFTLQLARFEAFDSFNDPWTYMIQSQWFQAHNLSEPIAISNSTGALSQVAFTKITHTRAGAQFLTAFIQGFFGLSHAYEAYAAAITLFFATGIASVTASVWLEPRVQRWLPIVWGLLFATCLSGFNFGALRGYLPQTAGLGLGLAAIVYTSQWIGTRSATVTSVGVAGILCAGSIITYSELMPFLALGLGSALLPQLVLKSLPFTEFSKRTAMLLLAVVICSNIELVRAVHAILGQAKAVVGEGIPWGVSEFLAHSAGGLAGFSDGGEWWGGRVWRGWTMAVGVLTLAGFGVARARRYPALVTPLVALLGFSAMLFTHYRWNTPSPFAIGTGQSWSQYKLANWSSIFLFALSGLGLGWFCQYRWGRCSFLVCAILAIAGGLAHHFQLAERRTTNVRHQTGIDFAPFHRLSAWLEESIRPALGKQRVMLSFGQNEGKSQQLFAFLLGDDNYSADWTNDPYVSWMVPRDELVPRIPLPEFQISIEQNNRALNRFGRYAFTPIQSFNWDVRAAPSDYGSELNESGWLKWVKSESIFKLTAPTFRLETPLSVTFYYVSMTKPLLVDIIVKDELGSITQTVDLSNGHQRFDSPALARIAVKAPKGPNATITFRSHSKPVRLSDSDSREVTFYIRNLTVEQLR